MNILFLDDDLDRCRKMVSWLPNVTAVLGAESCIRLLESKPWGLVFLDHDLGFPNTGGVVADHIARYELKVGAVAIHSRNIAGSRRMEEVLTKAGYPVRQVCFNDLPAELEELMAWAAEK